MLVWHFTWARRLLDKAKESSNVKHTRYQAVDTQVSYEWSPPGSWRQRDALVNLEISSRKSGRWTRAREGPLRGRGATGDPTLVVI